MYEAVTTQWLVAKFTPHRQWLKNMTARLYAYLEAVLKQYHILRRDSARDGTMDSVLVIICLFAEFWILSDL